MGFPAQGVEKNKKGIRPTAFGSVDATSVGATIPWVSQAERESASSANPHRWQSIVLALVDILLVFGSGLLAYKIRFSIDANDALYLLSHPLRQTSDVTKSYVGFLLLYAALVLLVGLSQKLYRITPGFSPIMQSLCIGRAVVLATIILTGFIYVSGIKIVSRLVVGLTALFSLGSLCAWRWFRAYLERRRLAKGIGLRHVIIAGAGREGTMLAEYFQRNPQLGYEFRGFLDSNGHEDARILGKIDDLARVARREFVDEIFIAVPADRELVKSVSVQAMRSGVGVKVLPVLYDGLAWLTPIEFVGDVPVRVLHREPIPAFGLFLKRTTDVIGSTLALITFAPLIAAIALAIRVDSGGPVYYKAFRVGKKGRRFICYKFRTMVPNADDLKDHLRKDNERHGPFFKISDDPRLTKVGGLLRKYSLDELPQLWNVLKGEMSLVGPRPHPVDDFNGYSLEHFRRLDVTPGITCLWQLDARHDPSFEKVIALDSQYIESWSYLLDLRILLRTIPAVVKGSGH